MATNVDISPRLEVGQELLNVPMGEMVKSLALGIAQAQWQLDKSSMTVSELMSGQRLCRDLDTGRLVDANNEPLADDAQPVVVDSRVFFGYVYKKEGDTVLRIPQKVSMMELGFMPAFYQFVDTIIEVKISITMQGVQEAGGTEKTSESSLSESNRNASSRSGCWWHGHSSSTSNSRNVEARTSTVDAKFSSRYSYSIEGASLLRTKLVPIPPPAILDERIRQLMEDEKIYRDWLLAGGDVSNLPGAWG